MKDEIERHVAEVFAVMKLTQTPNVIGISSRMLDAGWASIDIDGPTPASGYIYSGLWLHKLYSVMRAIEMAETQSL